MNIELTTEQVAAFNRGEIITITPKPKPKQWEPRGGGFSIFLECDQESVTKAPSIASFAAAGMERQTKESAEKAYGKMITHNRLLAYVDEFGGDWVADWADEGQGKYFIRYLHRNDSWFVVWNWSYRSLGTVYMSEECAEGLVAKLQSGEVVL
jgi:hypothetical protein